MNQPLPAPGWYQDPSGPGLRWWDGNRWTEHHQAPVPLPPPPTVGATALPGPAPAVPQQRWWHIPLLVGLGVLSTVLYIVIQFV